MISKKIKNLKIATILPYKENYTFEKASAASLWVAEFFKKSKFRINNNIYGSTNSKNYLTKNYVNIKLDSINIEKPKITVIPVKNIALPIVE